MIMKKLLPIFVITILGLGVSAQDNKTVTIDVSGTAEVQVAPDEVVFSLDVTNIDMDLQKAKSMNDETVVKVLGLTKRFNIPPQDVKTDYISLDKQYEYTREKDN